MHIYLKILMPDTIGVAFDQGSCSKTLSDDPIVYHR